MPGMGKHSPTEDGAARDESRRNHLWLLLLIAAPAAVEVWSGWIGLGTLCGFGEIHPLPGIWDGLKINTVLTLPIGMEAYAGFALYVWLASRAGESVRAFACRSAIGAFILSCLGQMTYHLLAAKDHTRAPSMVVVLVACLPVAVLAFAATLTHLMHADARAQERGASNTEAEPVSNTETAPAVTPEPEQPVTPPVTAPAAKRTVPVTPVRVTPDTADAGEGPRKRTEGEWFKEVRKLYAEQGDTLVVRKLMPQLKLIGGGKGIAIDKASEMLRTVKAEARATVEADDDTEAVG
jgi:hypothetical protein